VASFAFAGPAAAIPSRPVPDAGLSVATAPAPSGGAIPGIDVSMWQGPIDFSQVAVAGVRFVIAKATDGPTAVDPMYELDKAGAKAAGLAFTAYHFARPSSAWHDALRQADHFVDVAGLGPGDLVPALDVEESGGLSPRALTRWILAWLGRVTERLGVRPMVYTSPAGWAERTADTSAIAGAGYPMLWLAHWNTASPTVPGADWGGNGWTFWQFSDCGSVPGVGTCVDLDWHAGSSLDAVTIPNPDETPPTMTATAPASVDGPVIVTFDEAVRGIDAGNVELWQPDPGDEIGSTLRCRSGTGDAVDCATGAVRTVELDPSRALVPGQGYAVLVDPAGASPPVVDEAGNAAAAASRSFVGPTQLEEDAAGLAYAWRRVPSPGALGGSYVEERSPGATYSISFAGRSAVWHTVAGRSQGRAEVSIDGRSRGVFDQYAPSKRSRVARTFSGLGPGWHRLTVTVLGTRSRRARDSQVAVDGFRDGGRVAVTPHGRASWRRFFLSKASGGAVAITDEPRASVSLAFDGTGVDWYTVRGPSQGRAAMYVDGLLVRIVDNRSDSSTAGVVRSITGLPDTVHELRVVALGPQRAGSGSVVSVDRFVVVP